MNKKGELIGLQESHPINYYDVLTFLSTLETIYDFKNSRYFVDGLDNNEPMYDFNAEHCIHCVLHPTSIAT